MASMTSIPAKQGASPLGSEGSPSLRGRGTALLSFDVWDSKGECPCCGSEDIEYDLGNDRLICDWCGAYSASILDNDLDTWLMNTLDRFDYQDVYGKFDEDYDAWE